KAKKYRRKYTRRNYRNGLVVNTAWRRTNPLNHSFFFSSRRRHTRWPRDWSSDVCSSDLLTRIACITRYPLGRLRDQAHCRGDSRSEERRVGKECRSRWTTNDVKKTITMSWTSDQVTMPGNTNLKIRRTRVHIRNLHIRIT